MKHLGTKTIETKRLVLRRFTIEDAEAMFANWASDPEVTKYLTWPTHRSIEVTKKVLSFWLADYEKEDNYQWCIALKENDEAIGSLGVVHMNEEVGSVELGYCIGRKFWNQGYTSEAVEAVIRFFFDKVGMNRVEARHDVANSNSGRVMKKCGMSYEGTRVQGDANNQGICDCACYAIVKGKASTQTTGIGERRNVSEDQSSLSESTKTAQTCQANSESDQTDHKVSKKEIEKKVPKNVISDETIEYVGILAKLELNDEEKEQAKKDMGEMLDYIDKLNELDVTGVEPMSHVFPVNNVFREDVVTNGDGSKDTLANAPSMKDGGFKVPKTIGE